MTLIEQLLSLYRVDSQVRGLRSRLDAAERYANAQNRLLEDLRKQVEESETRRRHHQATVGNLESEIAGHDERIEKLREEMNSASTNKQYQALLTELNSIRDQRSKAEDRMLSEMEHLETIDKELEQLREQMAEREKIRDQAAKQREQREADVGQRLAELESDREKLAVGIPDEHLDLFDAMAEAYEGEAMAHVQEIDRKRREYACGCCHMQMPYEKVSRLRSTGEEVVQCPACHRILYLESEESESLASK